MRLLVFFHVAFPRLMKLSQREFKQTGSIGMRDFSQYRSVLEDGILVSRSIGLNGAQAEKYCAPYIDALGCTPDIKSFNSTGDFDVILRRRHTIGGVLIAVCN